MRVLLDMDDEKFAKLYALQELPGEVLGTDHDMTFNSVFSSDDIWNRIQDADLLNEKARAKIEEYGKDAFLDEVVGYLNKNFDANDGIAWDSIDNAVSSIFYEFRDKFAEMDKGSENQAPLEMGKTDLLQEKPLSDLPLEGLHKALERFDSVMEDSITATGVCGPWEVTRYGVQEAVPVFNICYCGDPVVSSRLGSEFHSAGAKYLDLERIGSISDKSFSQISDIVKSVYMFARMAPDEQKKIQENNQTQGR